MGGDRTPPHAPWLALRNVPTCEMADAPGILMATTRALRLGGVDAPAASAPVAALAIVTAVTIVIVREAARVPVALIASLLRFNELQALKADIPQLPGKGGHGLAFWSPFAPIRYLPDTQNLR